MCNITRSKKGIFEIKNANKDKDIYIVNPVNTRGVMGKGLALEF